MTLLNVSTSRKSLANFQKLFSKYQKELIAANRLYLLGIADSTKVSEQKCKSCQLPPLRMDPDKPHQ